MIPINEDLTKIVISFTCHMEFDDYFVTETTSHDRVSIVFGPMKLEQVAGVIAERKDHWRLAASMYKWLVLEQTPKQ